MISVVIPSFFSSGLLEERIKEINNSFEIIIIENSRDFNLKKNLETKYKNIEVVIPDKNIGYPAAFNLGISLSSNQYIFLTQPDVKLIDNCLEKLSELVRKFDDFTIITPYDIGKKDYSNYEIHKNYPKLKKNEYLLEQVDLVDLTWLINKKNFDKNDYFDANLLGLTATPLDKKDRNTFETFNLPNGEATDVFSFKDAVEGKYLVNYQKKEVNLKFPSRGIKYAELSEEFFETRLKATDEGTYTIDNEKLEDMSGTEIQEKWQELLTKKLDF